MKHHCLSCGNRLTASALAGLCSDCQRVDRHVKVAVQKLLTYDLTVKQIAASMLRIQQGLKV